MADPSPRLIRVMLDSNVLFSAIGWQGPPHVIFVHTQQSHLTLVLNDYILFETGRKLSDKRPRVLDRFETFVAGQLYELVATPTVEAVMANLDLVRRDRDDVPVALAALNARVDYLVTGDDDLHDPANTRLHEAVTVMKPREFCNQVLGGGER